MKVEMPQFAVWCGEYSRRFINKWDYYCLVSDAWLNGFYKAKEEAYKLAESQRHVPEFTPSALYCLGETKMEVEIQSNQLHGQHILTKEQFKTDMKTHYNCDDVRVHDDGNGFFSFQGTFQIKSRGSNHNDVS